LRACCIPLPTWGSPRFLPPDIPSACRDRRASWTYGAFPAAQRPLEESRRQPHCVTAAVAPSPFPPAVPDRSPATPLPESPSTCPERPERRPRGLAPSPSSGRPLHRCQWRCALFLPGLSSPSRSFRYAGVPPPVREVRRRRSRGIVYFEPAPFLVPPEGGWRRVACATAP
jgi:hypothetical protein